MPQNRAINVNTSTSASIQRLLSWQNRDSASMNGSFSPDESGIPPCLWQMRVFFPVAVTIIRPLPNSTVAPA